ncbi:TPA: hypothetical protein POA93_002292 [Escherichia coli]|nr:hypothetical protein [Escherichia coli]HDI6282616.1 hypothetical protein [Escherichia coli]
MKKLALALLTVVSFGGFAAEEMRIPSDTKATYTILDKDINGSMATIVTKRVGPSGTTFTKRLYDCSSWTVKYLGDGETFEQMKSSKFDSKMANIVEGSIADYVGRKACQ